MIEPKLTEAQARALLAEYPDARLSPDDIEGGLDPDRLAAEEAERVGELIGRMAEKVRTG